MKKTHFFLSFILVAIGTSLSIQTLLHAQEIEKKCVLHPALTPPLDFFHTESYSKFGYSDIVKEGTNPCGNISYEGHEGTDISVTKQDAEVGVPVYAAASGTVLWAFDGKYDQCTANKKHPQCRIAEGEFSPNMSKGATVCTDIGYYCQDEQWGCFWCFDGGNVIVLQHDDDSVFFASRYDHLKKGSLQVKKGDRVFAGEQIAEVGSAGNSTAPHLHFEIWGTTYYDPVDPWVPLEEKEKHFFSDIDQGTLEAEAAATLRQKGIIAGYGKNMFHGDQPVTRAEVLKFLLLGAGYSVGSTQQKSPFSDVSPLGWENPYVTKGVFHNIVQGFSDHTFRPHTEVTTADFIKMTGEVFHLEKELLHGYKDVSQEDWFWEYAGAVKKYDLLPNRPPRVLLPHTHMTRNEVAVAIYQVLQNH